MSALLEYPGLLPVDYQHCNRKCFEPHSLPTFSHYFRLLTHFPKEQQNNETKNHYNIHFLLLLIVLLLQLLLQNFTQWV
jgi:hypothetical protein